MNSEKAGNYLFNYAFTLGDIIHNHILKKELYITEPHRFYYTVLHKLHAILDVTSLLVTNIDGKPHYTDSIYLLLRTCLFDIVSLYFILDKQSDELEQKSRINRIMYDHVRVLSVCARDAAELEMIITKYPDCFENKKFRKDIVKVNIKMMSDEIEIKSFKDEVGYAINLYNIFSKVEHNGILSFNLLHDHFTETGSQRSKSKIYDSIGTISMSINFLLAAVWLKIEDVHFQQLILLTNQFVNPDEP